MPPQPLPIPCRLLILEWSAGYLEPLLSLLLLLVVLVLELFVLQLSMVRMMGGCLPQ